MYVPTVLSGDSRVSRKLHPPSAGSAGPDTFFSLPAGASGCPVAALLTLLQGSEEQEGGTRLCQPLWLQLTFALLRHSFLASSVFHSLSRKCLFYVPALCRTLAGLGTEHCLPGTVPSLYLASLVQPSVSHLAGQRQLLESMNEQGRGAAPGWHHSRTLLWACQRWLPPRCPGRIGRV